MYGASKPSCRARKRRTKGENCCTTPGSSSTRRVQHAHVNLDDGRGCREGGQRVRNFLSPGPDRIPSTATTSCPYPSSSIHATAPRLSADRPGADPSIEPVIVSFRTASALFRRRLPQFSGRLRLLRELVRRFRRLLQRFHGDLAHVARVNNVRARPFRGFGPARIVSERTCIVFAAAYTASTHYSTSSATSRAASVDTRPCAIEANAPARASSNSARLRSVVLVAPVRNRLLTGASWKRSSVSVRGRWPW